MARATAAAQNAILRGNGPARIFATSARTGAIARAIGPLRGAAAAVVLRRSAGAGFFAVAFAGTGTAIKAFDLSATADGARRMMAFRVITTGAAGAAAGGATGTTGGAVTTTAAPSATKATSANTKGKVFFGRGATSSSSGTLPSSEKGASSGATRGGGVVRPARFAGEATGVVGSTGSEMTRSVCSGVAEPVSEKSAEPVSENSAAESMDSRRVRRESPAGEKAPLWRSARTARTGEGDAFGLGDGLAGSELLTSLRPRRRSGNVAMAAATAARRPNGGEPGIPGDIAVIFTPFFSSTLHGENSGVAGSGLSAAPWKAGDWYIMAALG